MSERTSEHRWGWKTAIVGLFVIVLLITAVSRMISRTSDEAAQAEVQWPSAIVMKLAGGQEFMLDVAGTEAQMRQGLSGRQEVSTQGGMIFPYPNEDKRCFWMKDMRIPIDIVWLNASKKVLHIEANLTPDTYPQTYCADSTQYVVELKAGTAQAADLKVGDVVSLDL